MKKYGTILGITVLAAILAIPVFTWAHGWGWGGFGPMMGYGDRGYGYGCQFDDEDTALTVEQQEKLSDLDRKFSDETVTLRRQLWTKSTELNALLTKEAPDQAQVTAIRKEIRSLRDTLEEKGIDYGIEARKIAPENKGNGYSLGFGMMGDGSYRGGYHMGYGFRGC